MDFLKNKTGICSISAKSLIPSEQHEILISNLVYIQVWKELTNVELELINILSCEHITRTRSLIFTELTKLSHFAPTTSWPFFEKPVHCVGNEELWVIVRWKCSGKWGCSVANKSVFKVNESTCSFSKDLFTSRSICLQ